MSDELADAIQGRIAQLQSDIREKITEQGWYAVHVFPESQAGGYSFTYSIGFWPEHPEVIITNLPHRQAHSLIARAWDVVQEGRRFEDGKMVAEVIRNHDVAVEAVPEALAVDHLAWAIDFHFGARDGEPSDGTGGPLTAVQLVWPDPHGKFPWEPGYELEACPQPVFSRLQSESDDLRRECFERWMEAGCEASALSTLDLRAAVQHAQVIGNAEAERALDSQIAVREAREGSG